MQSLTFGPIVTPYKILLDKKDLLLIIMHPVIALNNNSNACSIASQLHKGWQVEKLHY